MFNEEGKSFQAEEEKGPCGLAPWLEWGQSLRRQACRLGRHEGLGAAIGLDNVLDGAAADGAAGVQGLFEAQATGIAEAHVAARVDDRVHGVLIANGALIAPLSCAWGHWRFGQAHWGVGGRPWGQGDTSQQVHGPVWPQVHGKTAPGLLSLHRLASACFP